MKHLVTKTVLVAVLGILISSCDSDDENYPAAPGPENFEVSQAYGDSSAIISKVNQFRERAGKALNTVPGAKTGRREINWDGVPSELVSPLPFPADFFNPTSATVPDGRKRGLIYFPANAPLLVSDKNFAEVDTAFQNQFKAFSKNKLFSPKGTNVSEIRFQVAGSNTPAYVRSFGVVFSDVDNASATIVEAYEGEKLIGSAKVQAADKKYSFVGLHTTNSKITRIKIVAGNSPLAPGVQDGATKDIVVLDDLIYSEPNAL